MKSQIGYNDCYIIGHQNLLHRVAAWLRRFNHALSILGLALFVLAALTPLRLSAQTGSSETLTVGYSVAYPSTTFPSGQSFATYQATGTRSTQSMAVDLNSLMANVVSSGGIPSDATIISMVYTGPLAVNVTEVTYSTQSYSSCNPSYLLGDVLAYPNVLTGSDLSSIHFVHEVGVSCPSVPTHPSVAGIYSMMTPGKTYSQDKIGNRNAIAQATVDGYFVRVPWNLVEGTAQGTYDFSIADSWISEIDAYNAANGTSKKLSIAFEAGTSTPSWLLSNIQTISAIDPKSCASYTEPMPWDPTFLQAWNQFLFAAGQHYDTNSDVSLVKFTGLNWLTYETILPHQPGGIVNGCTVDNDIATWQNAGYNSTLITNTFNLMFTNLAADYPDLPISLMGDENDLPPIGPTGAVDPADPMLPPAKWIPYGYSLIGNRMLGQNNALTSFYIEDSIAAYAQTNGTGYQTSGPVTNDPTCKMNSNRSPCETEAIFNTVIYNALNAGARYLELMYPDLENSAFSSTLTSAHSTIQSGNTGFPLSLDPATTERITIVYLPASDPSTPASVTETMTATSDIAADLNTLIPEVAEDIPSPDTSIIKSVQYVGPIPANEIYVSPYGTPLTTSDNCDINFALHTLSFPQTSTPTDSTSATFWEHLTLVDDTSNSCTTF